MHRNYFKIITFTWADTPYRAVSRIWTPDLWHTAHVILYCSWHPSDMTTGLHWQGFKAPVAAGKRVAKVVGATSSEGFLVVFVVIILLLSFHLYNVNCCALSRWTRHWKSFYCRSLTAKSPGKCRSCLTASIRYCTRTTRLVPVLHICAMNVENGQRGLHISGASVCYNSTGWIYCLFGESSIYLPSCLMLFDLLAQW